MGTGKKLPTLNIPIGFTKKNELGLSITLGLPNFVYM